MINPCLNDKNIYPDDDVLAKYLHDTKNIWDSFIELLKNDYPLLSLEWRYYNDGKSWLCKITKKSKTICWVSIWEKLFKITFYFNNKSEEIIKNSSLEQNIKTNYLNYERKGKIRPITIDVNKKSDLEIIKKLIEIKEKIK
ncbi:MAG: hypothetical protein A2086_17385 [Spirochaetes bacterium GWD1_27_9]|nr:MAG: hypothetical protein A2Z98_15400 [Spirochaetes bacterium GWB1_27_13]OHD27368.1 MAG: hypothetical protein A2Y34_07595 [Spirochaetes bacterium GWC1_27_15]OHD42994.1 MAG: hypothetical protein A2086_17385 [Spirochaetes bacterium GWD1_27_9]